MARPSLGQSKKVTPENLLGLGAERLAQLLAEVAETRVDLKRRLRMELAAQQGPGPLTAEIDRRLGAFETSRGRIGWRQGPAFIRDLDALRDLIAVRLAALDAGAASERLFRFMDTGAVSARRYNDRHGEFDRVFARAARDLGDLLSRAAPGPAAAALVDSLAANPAGWAAWLPDLLDASGPALAAETLRFMAERTAAAPGWVTLLRLLAGAAGALEAYRATFTAQALRTSSVAADLARRYLSAGRVADAGDILEGAAPKPAPRGRPPQVDPDWEEAWIAYLEAAGKPEAAQAARWTAFERTLSPAPLRAFLARLADFDDVEAEARALSIAAEAADLEAGLRFLMEWPALADAARVIEARKTDLKVDAELAELWAAKLRRRFPKAAHALLRGAAAAAFRRRDFKTSDRLTAEAESLG